MPNPYTFTVSHSYKLVEAALKAAPASTRALAGIVFTDLRHVHRITKHMRDNKLIRVVRWEPGSSGCPRPVFAWGPGRDANRPKPKSSKQRCREYRKRLRAKYGEETKHIVKAQQKTIPGRRIVIDGRVVYQQ